MSTTLILTVIACYFAIILTISYLTTKKKADNKDFFSGSRQSPWYVVAVAMIGTSISGVTFISVPGMVQFSAFGYLQMALGFVAGYFAIAYVLLPLYYKMNLSSIYTYLDKRFGNSSYKVGAAFFHEGAWCAVDRVYYDSLYGQLKTSEPRWEGMENVTNISSNLKEFYEFINNTFSFDTFIGTNSDTGTGTSTEQWTFDSTHHYWKPSTSTNEEYYQLQTTRFNIIINSLARLIKFKPDITDGIF